MISTAWNRSLPLPCGEGRAGAQRRSAVGVAGSERVRSRLCSDADTSRTLPSRTALYARDPHPARPCGLAPCPPRKGEGRALNRASQEPVADRLFVEVAADEHDA